MDEKKAEIKKWLKDNGKSRQWLASELLVTLGTVNAWLAGQYKIPAMKLQKIEELMSPPPVRVHLPDEWEAFVRRRAAEIGKSVEEFIVEAVLKGMDIRGL